jgi:hypothetical protein
MGALEDLDRLLIRAPDQPPMTYQEFDRYDAYRFLQNFTDDEWAELRSLWKRRPGEWQIYLAQLLDEGPTKQRVAILVEMMESMFIELMEEALDSLPEDLPNITLSEQTIARLLKRPERFSPNAFLDHPNLPRLLKAAGHPVQKV